jgi:hypothetical protein
MGEYKFSVYNVKQIGIMISYKYGQLIIRIPFVDIHLSFNKHANGVFIFGKQF